MPKTSTLLQLRSSHGDAFDGSSRGIAIGIGPNVVANGEAEGFQLNQGFVGVARHSALDALQAFSIEATIRPTQIEGDRRNIAEAQTPPIALFLDPSGKLIGSVHTQRGWVSVDSGATRVAAGTQVRVCVSRASSGKTELFIDDRLVGTAEIPGPLVNVGNEGFKIGSWVDGRRYPFIGSIAGIDISNGAHELGAVQKIQTRATQIASRFKEITGLERVEVNLFPDASRSRLQPIRDIMRGAGVDKLSDLATLQINQPTNIIPGQVMVAPRRSTGGAVVDWSSVAKSFSKATSVAVKKETLASTLTNRNSSAQLNRMLKSQASPPPARPGISPAMPLRGLGTRTPVSAATASEKQVSSAISKEELSRLPLKVRQENVLLRRSLDGARLSESFVRERGKPRLVDSDLVDRLDTDNPDQWPTSAEPTMRLMSLHTIPVNDAVIIAHRLDLTQTELRVEPQVTKLYIIAEEVICGPNARITWRRPGGTTPARSDDPDLNGRGYTGVHTKPGSRDGLDGENGRSGASGISGSRGKNSPELEMWVKTLTAIPQIDLNGEDGRTGGRGQRGGRGGRGADGEVGKRAWFFGWHCTSRPGHGGHGGNGANGGTGGRGGDGGRGGNITIGVLEDTLADTVTNKSFKIKNQGGQRGAGGDGGPGGSGGAGGRAGIGETCTDAQDGRPGAQGQPGPRGAQAHALGTDGEITLFEFTEDAWDEMLTRPWIMQLVPAEVFPGDTLTLRGSRFASTDRVHIGSSVLAPTLNPDESISVNVPLTIPGGERSVFVRRVDNTESNRLNVGIKPRLNVLPSALPPAADITISGNAFINGASVLVDGTAIPASFISQQELRFTMPGTGGTGSSGGSVIVEVRNPDGRVSNARAASKPRILEIPFQYGVHNLTFDNFKDGVPSWGTFEQTFGAAEVWHELLDPVFGHPVLTTAYYFFYEHFLKGEDRGGLATGFCTSLASTVADRFWLGHTDQTTLTKAPLHQMLTAVHGKLLSRESLIHFHDQGREGVARVERTARHIEATFLRGCDRNNAPLLFFIPSGAAWDDGYFDKLSDSHCVLPYRFVYPNGHPGPVLSPDLSTTITSLDGVDMYVWDCNEPENSNCRLELRMEDGQLRFQYFNGGASVQFSSDDGITLGVMSNGQYLLADHDLPFSGHLGLTRFIVDFLLSPADLQITDGVGLRTGNFGGQILSEIPGSHPAYLIPGMYLLPMDTALTRRIVGNGNGTYSYNMILPDGGSIVLEGISTSPGSVDTVAVNADGTQLRITPGSLKSFSFTMARQVNGQARAIAVEGLAGSPTEEVDVTVSPELSMVRVGNRGAAHAVDVRAFTIRRDEPAPVRKNFDAFNVPSNHDLVVAVEDWASLEMNVSALGFD